MSGYCPDCGNTICICTEFEATIHRTISVNLIFEIQSHSPIGDDEIRGHVVENIGGVINENNFIQSITVL